MQYSKKEKRKKKTSKEKLKELFMEGSFLAGSKRLSYLVGSFNKNITGTETYMKGLMSLGGSERSNFYTSNANRQYTFFHQW